MIIDLKAADSERIAHIAKFLIDGFSDTGSDVWQTRDEALLFVRESLQKERISRVALENSERVIGWIGGRATYRGRVWELHPLVVRRDCRGQGVGRALVNDFEEQVKVRGGSTIYLGTDDENGRTSLGGMDLYPNPLAAAAQIQNLSVTTRSSFIGRLASQSSACFPTRTGSANRTFSWRSEFRRRLTSNWSRRFSWSVRSCRREVRYHPQIR